MPCSVRSTADPTRAAWDARARVLERRDVREAIRITVPIAIAVTLATTALSGARSTTALALGVAMVVALVGIARLRNRRLRKRPHVVAFGLATIILAGRFVPIYLDVGVALFAHAYFGLIVVSAAVFLPWSGRWHAAWLLVAASAYGAAILTDPDVGATRVPGLSFAITAAVVSIAGNRLVRTRRRRTLAVELVLRTQRAALRTAQAQLEVIAHEDALTGLSNRRRLDEDVAVLEGRLARGLTGVAAVMIDLDAFKAYNDAVGHAAGDHTLHEAAAAIQDAVRSIDRVYRYGGEEILVLLEGESSDAALAIADRIVAAVKALRLAHPVADGGVMTVSAGAAGSDGRAVGPWTVIDEADRAMYEAKAAGRDRAVAFRTARDTDRLRLTVA